MKIRLLTLFFVLISFNSFSQIQVSKLVGKGAKDYKLGWGGFLKFAYPVSEAADISLEAAANFFLLKDDPEYGVAVVPIKIGYRYTFNRMGDGFYIQPQAGYNVAGVDANDDKFTGPVAAGSFGYLFPTSGKIQFDLGVLYETAFHKGGNANYVAIRLSHNFMIGRGRFDL